MNFKYKPGWMQLLLLGMIVLVMLFVVSVVVGLLIANMRDVSLGDIAKVDLAAAENASLGKWMQTISAIGMFVIPPLIFARLASTQSLHYAGFRKTYRFYWYPAAIAVMMLAIPMVGWLGELNQGIHFGGLDKWVRDSEAEAGKMIENLLAMRSFSDLLASLFVLAFLPAFAEELFFRGILQRIFIRITQKPLTGIVITAILFSLFHFQFLGFIPRVALGVVLGILYWYSGSIWPAILAHFVYNALQVTAVYLYKEKLITANLADDKIHTPFWLGLISIASVSALLYYLIKSSPANWGKEYEEELAGMRQQWSDMR
jgi:uncharacterized protein